MDNATAATQEEEVRGFAGEVESLEREREIFNTLLIIPVVPAPHAHGNVVVGFVETEVFLEQAVG